MKRALLLPRARASSACARRRPGADPTPCPLLPCAVNEDYARNWNQEEQELERTGAAIGRDAENPFDEVHFTSPWNREEHQRHIACKTECHLGTSRER